MRGRLPLDDARVVDTMRIDQVPKLTRETFVPRGSTPLYDAVAAAVATTDTVTLLADERVAFAVLTDGQENASREMTVDAVRKLLLDRQERCNWLVQYLGANQEAWAVAAQLGVAQAHALDFAVGSVGEAMRSMSASAGRYRAAPAASARKVAGFTDEERVKSAPPGKS